MPAFTTWAFTRWRLHRMWWRTSNCSSVLIYRPWEDEKLSWLGWLTCNGWLTHISGHPSATGRAQDGERTLARDWRSTAEPRGPDNVWTVAGKFCGKGGFKIWTEKDKRWWMTIAVMVKVMIRHRQNSENVMETEWNYSGSRIWIRAC